MADKKLTVQRSMDDFKRAYQSKRKLVERELEDFRYALGDQWSKEDQETLRKANMKPITDNRIAPNLFLLTGLERQNRTDFKAFPEGEEDGIKSDIASYLFKHAIKISDFSYKSSDQFKDGITCGESHLELYLDHTENILNGKPCWRKLDGNVLFPEPGFTEYDFRDCRYVYKIVIDLSKGDLINLYPDAKKDINKAGSGRLDLKSILGAEGDHLQKRTWPKDGEGSDTGDSDESKEESFDLIERYYKKWVETFFIADKDTGNIQESEDQDKAEAFIADYKNQIMADQQAYQGAVQQTMGAAMADPEIAMIPPQELQMTLEQSGMLPPAPPERNPERFLLITRQIPEIWCFAHVPGIEKPLGDARAWFYPKWKMYPFVPFFARFSTAPLTGDDRHLLIQGLVHGVKGVQEKHNKTEMLMLRHLNSTANSGWMSEEDAWVDKTQVKNFGSMSGISLEYKKGYQKPERIFPMPLSQGHHEISLESAEAIKSQLGINADLLATQEGGGSQSGRAIALRQKQGLLMVQEPFDNLSRSRIIAGRFLLSQLGEIFDTETAKKVLGEAFLIKNFPPPMEVVEGPMGMPAVDPATGQPAQQPMVDPKTGQPMQYDSEMAELAIAEVLAGDLGTYDVAVGEAVASETQKLANAQEVKDIATAYPGLIPPDILVEESQLPQSTKKKIIASIEQAQAMQQMMGTQTQPQPKKKSAETAAK